MIDKSSSAKLKKELGYSTYLFNQVHEPGSKAPWLVAMAL